MGLGGVYLCFASNDAFVGVIKDLPPGVDSVLQWLLGAKGGGALWRACKGTDEFAWYCSRGWLCIREWPPVGLESLRLRDEPSELREGGEWEWEWLWE